MLEPICNKCRWSDIVCLNPSSEYIGTIIEDINIDSCQDYYPMNDDELLSTTDEDTESIEF